MTRLMGMTFWGKERFLEQPAGGEADEAHASPYEKRRWHHTMRTAAAGDRPRPRAGRAVGAMHEDVVHRGGLTRTLMGGDGHGMARTCRMRSPPSMWIPLVVLAVLATIGGLVGSSQAFTGSPELSILAAVEHRQLAESHHLGIQSRASSIRPKAAIMELRSWRRVRTLHRRQLLKKSHGTTAARIPYGDMSASISRTQLKRPRTVTSGDRMALHHHFARRRRHRHIARLLFYVWRPALPDIWAQRLGPLYRASYNKYWVDELYGWAVHAAHDGRSAASLRLRFEAR